MPSSLLATERRRPAVTALRAVLPAGERRDSKSKGFWFESRWGSKTGTRPRETGSQGTETHQIRATVADMGRPPMPIGTHGVIRTTPAAKGFEARTRFRDFDGRTKQLRAVGRTKGIAEATLKARIRDKAAS